MPHAVKAGVGQSAEAVAEAVERGSGRRALVSRWYRQSASANAKLPLTAMAILEVDR